MSKRKSRVTPVRRIGNYARAKVGYAAKQNTSLYTVACQALALDGKPKPPGKKDKAWVWENIDFILGVSVANKPTKKSVRTKPSNSFEASDNFLSTYEWRRVRMQALKKYGPKCMCCGATPNEGAVMNVDHIKPRKFYPELALDVNNLQFLCHDCNHGKGNWDMTDWRPDLEYQKAVENYVIQLPNI